MSKELGQNGKSFDLYFFADVLNQPTCSGSQQLYLE